MEVAYLNPELREICSVKQVMELELGVECANFLKPLLFDFDAAEYVIDIFTFREPLISTFESEPALIFPLITNIVLIVVNGLDYKLHKVNWSDVYRLKIVHIGTRND